MTDTQRGILTLLGSALTGERRPLPDGFSLADALPLAGEHQISTLLYDGALRCGISADFPEMQQLSLAYYRNFAVSEQQLSLLAELFAAFAENGIDFLPIKGASLKQLYPRPELRIMTDCDILIREEQYASIRPVMCALGFTEGKESDHEYQWTRSGHLFELHKRLIPSYNRDYDAYYGSGWQLARKTAQRNRYELCREDSFIFLLVHLAKHYRESGIGCRHIADLYVCRSVWTELDEAYIVRELKKLRLDLFYRNILQTLAVWFGNGDCTTAAALITDTVFCSGSYGLERNQALSYALKEAALTGRSKDARFLHWFHAIFRPLRAMRVRYPVLKRVPLLLPLFWVVRIAQTLLFRRDHIAAVRQNARSVRAEEIDAYQESLRCVGLDYYF